MAKLNKVRTRDTKFTRVFNQVIKDSALSWKARGIFMYLWSLPDDWKFREIEIKNHSTDGKAALRTGLHELIKNHYLIIKTPVNSKNIKIGDSKWFLSDKKMSRDSDHRSPIKGVQSSDSDNRTLQSKEEPNTNKQNMNITNREKRRHAQVVSLLNVFQQLFVEDPNLTFEHYMNRWIINYSPVRIINVMEYAKKNCRTMNPSAIGSYMNGCLIYPMKPKRKTKKTARGDTNDSKYNRDAEKEMFGDDSNDSKYNHKARF